MRCAAGGGPADGYTTANGCTAAAPRHAAAGASAAASTGDASIRLLAEQREQLMAVDSARARVIDVVEEGIDLVLRGAQTEP